MEKFPLLKNRQVALLRADINTGTVLDKNYIYATTLNQEVYAVFDNIDLAIEFAKSIIMERNDIECGIYGNDPVALLILNRYNINSY
ncbi:hypothetical protein DBR11_25800 [Pedobacter sp. HMWF019]|uniref:hypothetical protein n=1 Tax=Pedobacter sp. HMWF019 TaxID=2056856 RepID=UPI000D361C9E|nr:hypothetical protein [Pedobacter sp. HMWF019]PTS93207.1 hypothetical protein DBR11_25800 [Pedobacter sp. HMWF019]